MNKDKEIVDFRGSQVYKWQVDVVLEIEKALSHSPYRPFLREFSVYNRLDNITNIAVEDNNIIGLRLFGHHLQKFPEAICLLTELRYLYFIENYAVSIPSHLMLKQQSPLMLVMI